MSGDKFSATWVSHTSISDFLTCTRAYYLKHIYKDPKTNHKVKIMSPSLALGQAVHEVLETLSVIPTEKRFHESLITKFDRVWETVKGKKGGFTSESVEAQYKRRGSLMLQRVMDNPGPLSNLSVKIKMDLPYYWLSEEENIILCGKIDWLEYFSDLDKVHIIDFKTGKREEDESSLQLPIYHLLVRHCQKRDIHKLSYWYLERDTSPSEVIPLPDLAESQDKVLKIARQIKLARTFNKFKCDHENGCYACRPMEMILKGEAEFVGTDSFNQDVYILENDLYENLKDSQII